MPALQVFLERPAATAIPFADAINHRSSSICTVAPPAAHLRCPSQPINNEEILAFIHPAYLLPLLLATLLFWNKSNFNGVTGDEPHYLVMANGIGKHASLEQTTPYKEAFDPREFSKFGIPPDQARLSPENMHTIEGPHGYYNMHNIGLPLLLALPFVLGGIVGAKLFMMFCGGLAILFSWKISGIFQRRRKAAGLPCWRLASPCRWSRLQTRSIRTSWRAYCR